jgi:hypothetical protein
MIEGVFTEDPITEMPDSLPMLLFPFEIILKIYEAHECVWVAYFERRVLINDGVSQCDSHTNT